MFRVNLSGSPQAIVYVDSRSASRALPLDEISHPGYQDSQKQTSVHIIGVSDEFHPGLLR
jgi:hypothetical protein